jgi:hypothetical protein
MMAHRGVGKTCGGGGASIRMPARAVLQRLEVDTQLQGGSGGKATTCFGAREKHGRGKGRRGCMSGCYERGGERTGVGIGTAATWRRREGGVQSVWHAHEQGPSAGSGAGVIEAGSGRARSAEQRSGERRGGPVGWGGAHLEERGGTWVTPGTCGSAEEKEGAGAGPREQCRF